MPKSRGALAAATDVASEGAICSQRDAATLVFDRGGSAAGPKPGAASCSQKLAGSRILRCLKTGTNKFLASEVSCDASRSATLALMSPTLAARLT